MIIRKSVFILICLAALALMLPPPSVAQDTPALYKDKCGHCHAADGSGKTAAGKKMEVPDLRAKAFVEMSDREMFESIGRGTRHKTYPHSYLYTGLKEQQVNNLIAYIRQLQKK